MKKTIINIVIAVVLLIIADFAKKVTSAKIYNELMFYLSNQKKKEFDELIESKKAKIFIQPFNRNFLKLSLIIGKNNKEEVKKYEEIFKNMVLNRKQKNALYSCLFDFYVSNEDKEEANKYYNLLKKIKHNANNDDLDITYDTYVEKGYKYLDVALQKLNNVKGNQLAVCEMHISQMYKNKGDAKNSDKYAKLAEKHINELSAKK